MDQNNTPLPPGALPQDVVDSETIKATPGEFVIPAEVVRFLGIDKLERLVTKAKESLAELEANGRIGGDPTPEPAAPPAPEGNATPPQPAFAEGGVVEGGGTTLPQENGFSGAKRFKNSTGQEVFIPYVNGEPMFPIPQGFSEAESTGPEAPQDRVAQVSQGAGGSTPLKSDSNANDAFVEQHNRPDVSEWSTEDFMNYGERRNSVGNRAMQGIVSAIPGGAIVSQIARFVTDRRAANFIDQMIETQQDLRGNPLTPEQSAALTASRENMKTGLSQQTGLTFSPMEPLSEVLGRITDFATGTRTPTTVSARGGGGPPKSSVKPEADRMLSSGAQVGDVVTPSRSDDQYSGLGSAMGTSDRRQGGNPSERERANAMSGAGGLYNRGGLIAKRKKK